MWRVVSEGKRSVSKISTPLQVPEPGPWRRASVGALGARPPRHRTARGALREGADSNSAPTRTARRPRRSPADPHAPPGAEATTNRPTHREALRTQPNHRDASAKPSAWTRTTPTGWAKPSGPTRTTDLAFAKPSRWFELPIWPSRSPPRWFRTTDLAFAKHSQVVSNYRLRLREALPGGSNYRLGLREALPSGFELPTWPSRSTPRWFRTTDLAFAKHSRVVSNYRLGLREALPSGLELQTWPSRSPPRWFGYLEAWLRVTARAASAMTASLVAASAVVPATKTATA